MVLFIVWILRLAIVDAVWSMGVVFFDYRLLLRFQA